mgnify:FL=1
MKKPKTPRWPDYEVIDLDKLTGRTIVTFGTTLYLRKDKQALRIVFPTGQSFTFCPADEVAENDLLGG